MHFFKEDKVVLNRPGFKASSRGFGKLSAPVVNIAMRFIGTVFRDGERSRFIGFLLLVLVSLLHVWLALKLVHSTQKQEKIKPVLIEVSLMASLVQAHNISPPVIPPKIVKPKTVESKQPVQSSPKKKMPSEQSKLIAKKVVSKQPAEVVTVPHFEAFKPIVNAVAPVAKPAPIVAPVAKENERATCVACPELKFPTIAQRRGWQGSVLLKFQLTPSGLAENITVVRSSGHELLDETAIENAKESRFTTTNTGELRNVTKSYKFTLKEE